MQSVLRYFFTLTQTDWRGNAVIVLGSAHRKMFLQYYLLYLCIFKLDDFRLIYGNIIVKIMESQSSDQAEILERVRHLSGETAAITDIFSANQSVRMNFGVAQVFIPSHVPCNLINVQC